MGCELLGRCRAWVRSWLGLFGQCRAGVPSRRGVDLQATRGCACCAQRGGLGSALGGAPSCCPPGMHVLLQMFLLLQLIDCPQPTRCTLQSAAHPSNPSQYLAQKSAAAGLFSELARHPGVLAPQEQVRIACSSAASSAPALPQLTLGAALPALACGGPGLAGGAGCASRPCVGHCSHAPNSCTL